MWASKATDSLLKVSDNVNLLRLAISAEVSAVDHDHTILMRAAKFGRLQCCMCLLQSFPDSVNIQNSSGFSALHYAAFNGHEEIVFLLVAADADPSLRNIYGETALDAAKKGRHLTLAKKMEESGLFPEHRRIGSIDSSNHEEKYFQIINDFVHQQSHASTKISPHDEMAAMTKDERPLTRSEAKLLHLKILSSLGESTAFHNNDEITEPPSTGSQPHVQIEVRTETQLFPLLNTNPPSGGKSTITASKDDTTVGRSRTNHIVLKDLSVGKHHAVISYFEGVGFCVRDLGSKHGTAVGGRRVGLSEGGLRSNLLLSEGSVLRFGRVEGVVVRLPPAAVPAVITKG